MFCHPSLKELTLGKLPVSVLISCQCGHGEWQWKAVARRQRRTATIGAALRHDTSRKRWRNLAFTFQLIDKRKKKKSLHHAPFWTHALRDWLSFFVWNCFPALKETSSVCVNHLFSFVVVSGVSLLHVLVDTMSIVALTFDLQQNVFIFGLMHCRFSLVAFACLGTTTFLHQRGFAQNLDNQRATWSR